MKLLHKITLICLLTLGSSQVQASEWVYTFRPGDTLWDLCEKYIAAPNCWQKIATRNRIEQPRGIKPGTRLYLPISWLKVLPASAKVLSARGDVVVKRAENEASIALNSGAEILVGDAVITNEGTATLEFADKSILIITPGSEVRFDTLSLYGESGMVDTRVRLNRGRARAKVRPSQGPASRYEILTPAAVAAVRGTDFRVVAEPADPPVMRTEVVEGNVAVANDAGEQSLEQGYALEAVSGETPQKPVKLLPPPVFTSDTPETVSAFPWGISWRQVEDAAAYRIQIYRQGLLFDDLLQEQKLSGSSYAVPLLEAGNYEVLLRAIDARGFEGMESRYQMAVVSPQEVNPLDVKVNIENTDGKRSLRWHWEAPEDVKQYIVELSVDSDSDGQEKKRFKVMDNQLLQGVSESGVYRLKVAPLVGGQTLAFSDETSIRVRDENAPPVWIQAIIGVTLLIIIF